MNSERDKSEERELERLVLTRLIRLDASIHGILMGTFFGLIVFVATNWLILKGGPNVGQHLSLLSHFFFGYEVTFFGSLVGFVYGFLAGFVIGFMMATVYNWLVDLREARQAARQSQRRSEKAAVTRTAKMESEAK